MVEIVIAMAIFAIGFVAVCAIFPVALTLQRETVDDVTAQQVGRNVKAILAAQEDDFIDKDVFNYPPSGNPYWDDELVHSPHHDDANPDFFTDVLPPAQRTYPSSQPDMSLRTTSWVPLVRRSNDVASPGWFIYTLVMTRRPTDTWPSKASDSANPDDPETIPEVASATVNATVGSSSLTVTGGTPTTDFTVGMLILDNCGNEYRVQGVQGSTLDLGTNTFVVGHPTTGDPPTAIWYARPAGPGKSSPLRRIETTFMTEEGGSTLVLIFDSHVGSPTEIIGTFSGGGSFSNTAGFTTANPGSGGTFNNAPFGPAYNGNMHRTNGAGTGANTAEWVITGLPAGDYKIWATWSYFDGGSPTPSGWRSSNAPFSIFDNNTQQGAIVVNQRLAGVLSETYDGYNWAPLATATIASGTLKVRVTDNADGQTCADAIRVQRVD